MDCLEGMKQIPDGTIDAVICDLPYGYLEAKWDVAIPIEPLWEQYKRIIKKDGSIILFGNEPFSSMLRTSNAEMYRYDWYWQKNSCANFALAPFMPQKNIETISVFSYANIAPNSKLKMKYNPQGLRPCIKMHAYSNNDENFRPRKGGRKAYVQHMEGYPFQLISNFGKDLDSWHPTQKPVDLLRYLVLTYTNEGDTVLDNCMGSGTTAIACIKERRHFIGFELSKEYFDKAVRRIKAEQAQLMLF